MRKRGYYGYDSSYNASCYYVDDRDGLWRVDVVNELASEPDYEVYRIDDDELPPTVDWLSLEHPAFDEGVYETINR